MQHLGPKARKSRKYRAVTIVATTLLLAGLYLLSILIAPKLPNQAAKAAEAPIDEDRVIVPSADINAQFYEGGPEILNKGAWHRYSERGNPRDGGNFILTGHRFVFRMTPLLTRQQSTFYNIERIHEGDEIIVHWRGQKYVYRVTKIHKVRPDAVEVEEPTDQPRLTMYSCTLAGKYDGRIVVEAVPV